MPTYRFLRRYLQRRLPAPLTLRQVDRLIRQLMLYRDLIDRTQEGPPMNLVELDRALRQLRLSGMAAVELPGFDWTGRPGFRVLTHPRGSDSFPWF